MPSGTPFLFLLQRGDQALCDLERLDLYTAIVSIPVRPYQGAVLVHALEPPVDELVQRDRGGNEVRPLAGRRPLRVCAVRPEGHDAPRLSIVVVFLLVPGGVGLRPAIGRFERPYLAGRHDTLDEPLLVRERGGAI